tara:strand:+ start:483 stop:3299 length:2817 start_codon:yes stop_codon:yes gene_type:complete
MAKTGTFLSHSLRVALMAVVCAFVGLWVPQTALAETEAPEPAERAIGEGRVTAEQPRPGVVYEVVVQGAMKTEPDAVLIKLRSKPDTILSTEVLRADVLRLYEMGLFQDISVIRDEGPNGSIVLTFKLVEKPSVNTVTVEGNDKISEEDILAEVDIKTYQVVDVPKVKNNLDKIKKLYIDKGYFLAEVTYRIEAATRSQSEDAADMPYGEDEMAVRNPVIRVVEENRPKEHLRDVVFVVNENAKVKVEEIQFTGNANLGADEIKAFMPTKENHPLGVFTEWGTYKEEAFDMDIMAIEAVYQDKGFMNVKVGNPRVLLSPDKTRLSLHIPIQEGEQFYLEGYGVAGDLVVEDKKELKAKRESNPDQIYFVKEQLLKRTQAKAGDLFARSKIGQDVMAIADAYRDVGYAYVNVAPQILPGEKEKHIKMTLMVDSGPRVTIERIDIAGNLKTQDKVIRRELRVYEGELYSASLLKLSEQRVNALGFFETVEVQTKPGSQGDRMNIELRVKERPTGTFQLGAGFSNVENIIVTGQVSQNNFLGRGQTLSASLQWSAFRRVFDLRFVDPNFMYVGQAPITFAFTAYNTQRFMVGFARNSSGGDLTLGYPIGRAFGAGKVSRQWFQDSHPMVRAYIPDPDNLRLFGTYNAERVQIEEQSFDVTLLGLQSEIPRYTTSNKLALQMDQRNNRMFPSAGYFFQLQTEVASPYLGSSLMPGFEKSMAEVFNPLVPSGEPLSTQGLPNVFQRHSLDARIYFNLDSFFPLKNVVFKSSMNWGMLNTQDRTLVFENYFLGGFNTIRGYFIRSIGPVEQVGGLDPDDALVDFNMGGNKQFISNNEIEFPILTQVGIRGVLFYDMGNTFAAGENFFYWGQEPHEANKNAVFDPIRDLPYGLYRAAGVGIRWFSPIGPLRFEWGFPLTPRPVGTRGFVAGDRPVLFEFNIGNSF